MPNAMDAAAISTTYLPWRSMRRTKAGHGITWADRCSYIGSISASREQPLEHDRLAAAQAAHRRVHHDRIVGVPVKHFQRRRFSRACRQRTNGRRELLMHGPIG